MNRMPLIPLLLVVALAACQRQTPATQSGDHAAAAAAPSAAAAGAATPAAADDAMPAEAAPHPPGTTMARSGMQPGPGAIDPEAFAGQFRGTLPCADCPGIDETLVLGADGRFTLTDVYRERPQGTLHVQGTWSTESSDQRVRLHAAGGDAPDRLFAIDDNDTLTLLSQQGADADTNLMNYSLSRSK